mmetsp:Transcript_2777/g.3800  ORF Transcript_2777/g.3800 Transcript_2777/m.3800 type:complete len:261 (-) Transcript_2777:115-897(-)|eukprot:CAMPEP_0185724906 /NCGR_PEP_ID=MMETSP1171-20130828/1262_1 /TAXON_ID=374046 /ORGANISM="Helicotheca tamensis, Strain CCMP826" /LENGTH=260 /DNA_ID=CAMNT_0028392873 /DNA_START=95 /DNA_END=877 /DNA_ORIENTATION=-
MSSKEEKKSEEDRQYVWIVRYGVTEYSLVEGVGPYDSDIDPIEGVAHADAIAKRLLSHRSSRPSAVYADPFQRCAHTAHIIASTLSTPLCIEEGLTEWQTPSLLVNAADGIMTFPKSAQQLKKLYDSIDLNYKSVNPMANKDDGVVAGAPKFEESTQDLKVRCACTMDKLLSSSGTNNSNLVIVSHAPCNQMLAHHLAHDKTVVGPWSLGGITCFSRSVTAEGEAKYGEWTCEYFSDTTHMPDGDYKDGVKGRWSLPEFQ